ncbi:nucleotidyltransferase domain-containing protein [Neomoorella humiferrea]|uniref:Nucleotidyltransferase domain protein n=1 Tax=Neomoorella humiferrea TaxID=676965 RepID=A0A2T0AUT7_9FIRM|nr:nucleotidyltransferase domain-containing protein [Moorella humiferrea]PRR74272.1 Nucleotidyltransferase domain protein [Moorella humiferrea]
MNARDLAIARKIKKRLAEKIPLYEVRLFGSRARGQATPDSDLDLYLETGPLSREERRLISDIVWEVGFENDIVIVPLAVERSEVLNGPFSISTLYRSIKNEGIKV